MAVIYHVLFLGVLCFATGSKLIKPTSLHEVWNGLVLHTSNIGKCQTCSRNRNYVESVLNEYEMRNMRIEIVKQTILKKLGMSRAPKVDVPLNNLPQPLREGNLILNNQIPNMEKVKSQVDDRIIILASNSRCALKKNTIEINLTLNLPSSLQGVEVIGAKLWFYTSQTHLKNCSITTSTCNDPKQQTKSSGNSSRQLSLNDGWTELDITRALEGSSKNNEDCLELSVMCEEEYDLDNLCVDIATKETSMKPFALVDVQPQINESRNKRNVNCTKGATECCRETLYVSFADIGWGDWILQPQGYHAYYCKGNCANAATISLSATPYHSVIRKLYHHTINNDHQLDVTPCCTPRDLSPVQLLYVDQNKSLHQKTIPNLTVDSCGCM